MIKSIILNNFQSHKKSKLKFHKNINVVHGLSDSGKSAFIRSIDCVLRRKAFYLNFLEDSGSVSIMFENDDVITREFKRTKRKTCPTCKCKVKKDSQVCNECGELIPVNPSSDSYYLNGDKKEKFGTKLPELITDFTRMFPINFTDVENFINLSKQHDDMFFLGESYKGSVRNKMISSLIVDSEKVDKLIKTLKPEKLNEDQSIRFNSGQIDINKNKIKSSEVAYGELQSINKDIFIIEQDIIRYRASMISLKNFKSQIDAENATLKHSNVIAKLYERLHKSSELNESLIRLEIRLKSLINIKESLQTLKRYDNIKLSSFDEDNFNTLSSEIDLIKKDIFSLLKIQSQLMIVSKKSKLSICDLPDNTLDDMIKSQECMMELSALNGAINAKNKTVNDSLNALNHINSEISIFTKEFNDNLDDSLCPITNEKYCESCIEVMKNEVA